MLHRYSASIIAAALSLGLTLAATDSKAAGSNTKCNALLLEKAISKPTALEEPFSVQVNDVTYSIGYQFSSAGSGSSSNVYVTQDLSTVLKFYPNRVRSMLMIHGPEKAPHTATARYEYWVTRFYEEGNFPVVPVTDIQTSRRHPVTRQFGSWIVKPYQAGISLSNTSWPEPWELSRIGWGDRKRKVFSVTGETLGTIFNAHKALTTELRHYHTEARFRVFLDQHHIVPERAFKGLEHVWKIGDYFVDLNWVYTQNGWILIDP